MAEERLQKLIARSGLCSRRDADEMIREGRVTVNGEVARPGQKADPERDHIKIDGKRLRPPEPLRYILLYKPTGVITTCEDPEERTTVIDLVKPRVKERVFPVGRLDFNSEGLLLLTNDGELAGKVGHPRHGVIREYEVKVKGDLTDRELARLKRGVRIEGHLVRPILVERLARTRKAGNTWWRIQVGEGRTHEVRELFFRAGHHVLRLKRVAIGPIRDRELAPGEFRDLTPREIEALRRAARRKKTGKDEGRRPPRLESGRAKGRRTTRGAKS